jgi:superfamily II DNA or RNA helicase|tara:strand:+ start:272 stop:1987 length:1716 start_codon:yes stop_codon:yes gene_type:complete
MSFINDSLFADGPWQAMERAVARLMLHGNFQNVKLVGRTGDGGADVLASRFGKRYIVQVKFRRSGGIGQDVVDDILEARIRYRADIPIIATNRVFSETVYRRQVELMSSGVPLQLWDGMKLKEEWNLLTENSNCLNPPRKYQKGPINNIIDFFLSGGKSGIIIMATGLGKTFVAASAIRQIFDTGGRNACKMLVLAHTNELVYQLERAFWPFLSKHQTTSIWNGYEKGNLESSLITFACIASVSSELERYNELPVDYDLIAIDEAHHAGSSSYRNLIQETGAGAPHGPFLLGMTATPWRSDEHDIEEIFKETLCSIDIVQGMVNGYLSNVDYRMHVDNINWEQISKTKDVTPRALNRSLFIQEWDDAVIDVLQKTWDEVVRPKAIVFCTTIDHAFTIRDRINATGFSSAEVIYSGTFNGRKMSPIERSVTLCDFSDGMTGVMCAVDIFNEGIDVPDVNILVFQRVTHSRRIFVQQLGRGLRVSPGKDKVIVLDFVSDIRRFAAGLELKNKLASAQRYLRLGNPVKFVNRTGEDPRAEGFLKEWLRDVAAIQDAGEDDHILKFPPDLDSINE